MTETLGLVSTDWYFHSYGETQLILSLQLYIRIMKSTRAVFSLGLSATRAQVLSSQGKHGEVPMD